MKIQTPTRSANGRTYFITEGQNPKLLYENKCLVGGILFFVFDKLLTYRDFDMYFMMQLIKTSKFCWDL